MSSSAKGDPDRMPWVEPGDVERLSRDWGFNYFTQPVMRAWNNFWDHEGPHGDLQDHYAAAWTRVAERFEDHPAVLGYDIMNEPAAGSHLSFFVSIGSTSDPDGSAPRFDAEVLKPFYDRMIAAIRAVDTDGWIFYEPRFAAPADGWPSFLPVLDDPREGEKRPGSGARGPLRDHGSSAGPALHLGLPTGGRRDALARIIHNPG